jgi:phenylpyruvate tautomerase
MPALQIHTSATASVSDSFLRGLSAELSRELAKPEAYVLVGITRAEMLFGGSDEPACLAVLKNIGTFTPTQTQKLSALLCQRLSEGLGVAPSRTYIEFVNAQGYLWGHDGDTFASARASST